MKTSTTPAKSTTKSKLRICISTKINPKKRKQNTKSSASSTRTVKAKNPNGKAFNIEQTLDYLA